jgi:DNA replication protein DnaC
MSADAVVTTLKSMKLHGMAGAVAELAEQGSPAYRQSRELLDTLIKAEVAEREVRSINYQMKIARFPAHRDLAGFYFKDGSMSEGQVKALHRCDFLHETENIVLIGGPGTGKTHIAPWAQRAATLGPRFMLTTPITAPRMITTAAEPPITSGRLSLMNCAGSMIVNGAAHPRRAQAHHRR